MRDTPIASSRVDGKSSPRMLLDTNVWRALVDADAVEQLRSLVRDRGVKIVSSPAVIYETLRIPDAALCKRITRAQTLESWVHPMSEAFDCAEDLRRAVIRHRPAWLSQNPDLRYWYALRADWLGGWRRRVRNTPHLEAKYVRQLGGAALDEARAGVKAARSDYERMGLRFHQLNFGEVTAMLGRDTPGWDGQGFDAWRAKSMMIWDRGLRSEQSAFHDWLGPWVDLPRTLSRTSGEWVRFWTSEVELEELPREWVRWAFEHAQATRKVTPGTPVDNQISTYLIDCEYFVTADVAFAQIAERVRALGRVRLAKSLTVNRHRAVDELLNYVREVGPAPGCVV